MALKAWLYDFKTGEGIREETVIGSPSASWDYEGENSADITLKSSSSSLEDDYEPFRRGLMIFEESGSSRKVIHAGAISKTQIDVVKNTITLGIGSTLDYLKNVFIYPYRAVTDSEEGFTIPKGTADVNAARQILRFPWTEGAPSSSSLPSAPSNISVSVLSDSSKYTLSEAMTFFYSDGTSIYDALDELKGLRQGIEIREVYSVSQTGTPNINISLEVFNRFGNNRKHMKTKNLPKNRVLSYSISEEPYSISRSIIVSRDSDKEEKINSDLQHKTRNSDPVLFDVYESLTEEATSAEMALILDSRLNTEKYNASIYEITFEDDRGHDLVLADFAGSILTSDLPRLGSKSRIIGITHTVGTNSYDVEITTDWSALAYPQPRRKQKKEEAYKKEKDRKYKNQKPRKGNGTDNDYRFPPGGGGFPKPDIPVIPPAPTPPDTGGGGGIPDPDPLPTDDDGLNDKPLPDANSSLGDGMESEGETIWRMEENKGSGGSQSTMPWYNSFVGASNPEKVNLNSGVMGGNQTAAGNVSLISDINERGELFFLGYHSYEDLYTSPTHAEAGDWMRINNAHWIVGGWTGGDLTGAHNGYSGYGRLGSKLLTFDPSEQLLDFELPPNPLAVMSIYKTKPTNGVFSEPTPVHSRLNINYSWFEDVPWKDVSEINEDLASGYSESYLAKGGMILDQLYAVGSTVFLSFIKIRVFSPSYPSTLSSILYEQAIMKLSPDGTIEWTPEIFYGGTIYNFTQSGGGSRPWREGDENFTFLPTAKMTQRHIHHRQALGGYKKISVNVGGSLHLRDMFSTASRPFQRLSNGDLGIVQGGGSNTKITWGGYSSVPVLTKDHTGSLKYLSLGANSVSNSGSQAQIISSSIHDKAPLPVLPWELKRSYSTDYSMSGNFNTGFFQIKGNYFFTSSRVNSRPYSIHYYESSKNTVNTVFLDINNPHDSINLHDNTWTYSDGFWLYSFSYVSIGGSIPRAYKITPMTAGSRYPEKGGSSPSDLFVYYDWDMLQIKTPSDLGGIEVGRYVLKVYQEEDSPMETSAYLPNGSYAFRFGENGFEEGVETFIEWQIWAARDILNTDEDGNSAPVYSVKVSLTPQGGTPIETSGTPVVVDNRR